VGFDIEDYPGKYIVVEGPDFSGKDTQCRLLVEWLRQEGYDVFFMREPGTGHLGNKIREILLNIKGEFLSADAEMLLFMANRAQIRDEYILPALRRGQVVVSSRDRLSSRTYQGYGRGLSIEAIQSIGDYAMGGLRPNLYLVLLKELDSLLEWRSESLDRIEQEDKAFFERVWRGYRDFVDQNPDIAREIKAGRSVEEVHESIKLEVGRLLLG